MELSTLSIDRVDAYSDERPMGSIDLSDGATELMLDMNGLQDIEFKSFADDEIVALRREQTSGESMKLFS